MQNKNMNLVDVQKAVEYTYSRGNINRVVLHEITENMEIDKLVAKAVEGIIEYLNKTYSYESKNTRLTWIKDWSEEELTDLVLQVMVVVCQQATPTLFTSIAGQLAGILRYPSKVDGLKTISEIIAICCHANLFDIQAPYESDTGSLMVINMYPLSKKTMEYIYNTKYLPPMVCEPNELTNNRSCGYLTKTDSVILGSGNHHDYNLALDALNIMNSVPLSLNVKFLTTYSETLSENQLKNKSVFSSVQDKKDKQFNLFASTSYKVYKDLIHQGNLFYLTHRPDERGRSYAQGYHVNTQGNSFRKAAIDFAHKEIIEGV